MSTSGRFVLAVLLCCSHIGFISAISCNSLPDYSSLTVDRSNYVAAHGKLKVDGVHLVDEYDERIQLTGMSSHGLHWFSNCYTKESLTFLAKNWGMTVFRAAMYIGEGGYATNPTFNKNMVKDIVSWCEEIGIYVIIDFHVLDPGDPNYYLTSEGASTGVAIDFWKEMANLYKNKKHVMYEIANEPNDLSLPDSIPISKVNAYSNAVIAAIRAIDPETIIIVGSPWWSQSIDKAAANPVANPYNVMYAFHWYAGTHNFLFDRVVQYSTVIPIFVTEWGTSDVTGSDTPNLNVAQKFLDFFSGTSSYGSVKISWTAWSYAARSDHLAALNPSACAAKAWDNTQCSGTYIKNYMKVPPTPTPVAAPTGSPPTASPPTRAPTASPPSASPPSATPSDCKPKIGQCGGQGYTGPTCCKDGWSCIYINQWWSQCDDPAYFTPTPVPTRMPTFPDGSVPANCKPKIGQCGGQGYTGPTCCKDGWSCVYINEWWSQCDDPEYYSPTQTPTKAPVGAPSAPAPTPKPTQAPVAPASPTPKPTPVPTKAPVNPTPKPTQPPVAPQPSPVPTKAPVGSPTPKPTPAPSKQPTAGGCSALYGQCAGLNWAGPTCCEAGSTCMYQNDWYSQCLPAARALRGGR